MVASACPGTTWQDAVGELRPISMQPDDDDADGVQNYDDRCRLIRAYTVDGCPITGLASRDDADFDGVANARDRCDDDSGIGPHGCPPKMPGAAKTGDVDYVLDRVTADFPRDFASVAPDNGPTIAFERAHATNVIDGTYTARFGPYATVEVARVELNNLVNELSAANPSCCRMKVVTSERRARWSVTASEPAFRSLALEATVERSATRYDVVLRVGRF